MRRSIITWLSVVMFVSLGAYAQQLQPGGVFLSSNGTPAGPWNPYMLAASGTPSPFTPEGIALYYSSTNTPAGPWYPCTLATCFQTTGTTLWISSHFATNSSTNLYISLSQDGQNWSDITGSFVYSDTNGGVVHDPTLAYINGLWYAAYLNVTFGTGTTWGLASSPDLVHWTFVQDVSAALAGQSAQYTWSPTWFFDSDGSIHILTSLTPNCGTGCATVNNFALYEQHPTSAGNLGGTWSSPVQITGTALPVGNLTTPGLYNPFILKVGSTYNLFYGNAQNLYIEVASSTSLTSGYNTAVQTGNWASWGNTWEGSWVQPTSSTTANVYFEGDTGGVSAHEYVSTCTGASISAWACTSPSAVTNLTGNVMSQGSYGYYTAMSPVGAAQPPLSSVLMADAVPPTLAPQNSVMAGPASGGPGPMTAQTAPTFSGANLTNLPTTYNATFTMRDALITGVNGSFAPAASEVHFTEYQGTAYIDSFYTTTGTPGNYQFRGQDSAGGNVLTELALTKTSVTLGPTTYANCTALTTSSNVIGCTASDARLKILRENLTPKVALAFASALTERFYDFKDPWGMFQDRREHLGLLAQDIQKASPEIARAMVTTMAPTDLTPNGTLSIDYSQTGVVALAAIKELQSEVVALRKQVKALQKR